MAKGPQQRFKAWVGKSKLAGGVSPQSRAGTVKRYELYARKSMAEVEGKMNDLVALMQGATPDLMLEALLPIFEKSQRYCPVKTGLLRSTGDLHVSEHNDVFTRVVISYGGEGRAYYAPIVHERVDLFHKPPTRAKWLQQAVEEGVEDLRSHLLEAYSTLLNLGSDGGGGGGGKPRLRSAPAVAAPIPSSPKPRYRAKMGGS